MGRFDLYYKIEEGDIIILPEFIRCPAKLLAPLRAYTYILGSFDSKARIGEGCLILSHAGTTGRGGERGRHGKAQTFSKKSETHQDNKNRKA